MSGGALLERQAIRGGTHSKPLRPPPPLLLLLLSSTLPTSATPHARLTSFSLAAPPPHFFFTPIPSVSRAILQYFQPSRVLIQACEWRSLRRCGLVFHPFCVYSKEVERGEEKVEREEMRGKSHGSSNFVR